MTSSMFGASSISVAGMPRAFLPFHAGAPALLMRTASPPGKVLGCSPSVPTCECSAGCSCAGGTDSCAGGSDCSCTGKAGPVRSPWRSADASTSRDASGGPSIFLAMFGSLTPSGWAPATANSAWFGADIRDNLGIPHGTAKTAFLLWPGCGTCLPGFVDWGRFCSLPMSPGGGDDDPEADDIWMWMKAWNQLVNNIDLVAFFILMNYSAVVGPCLIARLLGGDCVYDKVTLFDADISANGFSIPFLPFVWINRHRTAAANNSYDEASCGDGDGECACIVSELAGTILHELSHTCGASEGYAHLLSQFYRYYFATRYGYDHANCCAYQQGNPSSWSEFDYTYATGDADDVLNAVCYAQHTFTGGRWIMSCPC
jgi:hypothetical protein